MPTGRVSSVWSKPSRGFKLIVPPDPGPPPVPGYDLVFSAVDQDDWALVIAAYTSGTNATVTGTAPNCTGVTLP